MKRYKTLLLLLGLVFMATSCIPLKDTIPLQPDKNLELNEYGLIEYRREEYRLTKDDVIQINLFTPDSESIRKYYGEKLGTGGQVNIGRGIGQGLPQNNQVGFQIDGKGEIDIPRIGKLKVEGLTLKEAEDVVRNEFLKYIKAENLFVEVIMAGINYTVVGEQGGGNFFTPNNNFTIIEAIAQSGGQLTLLGDWKKVRVLRQYPEGSRWITLDLTKESVMNSEYFWLQPNDIIIVNPRIQKQFGIGLNPIQTVGTILSAMTTALALFLFFDRL